MSLRSLIAICAICLISSTAQAQGQSLFGNGTTGSGATGSGTTGATNAATGASNTAQSATGGNTGNFEGAAADSPLGQTNLNAADGTLSEQVGQNAFIGQGQQGFIGNRNAGQGGNFGTQAQFGNMNQNNNRQQPRQTSDRKQMRPQFRLGFTAPTIPAKTVNLNLQRRMSGLSSLNRKFPNVQFHVDQAGSVTLTGQANNSHDRRLMEALVRLEPGVRTVKNTMTIAE